MKQQRLKIDDYFSTSDLALASAIALYYPLEVIDRTENPFKAQFLFKKDDQLTKLIESYWRCELKVEPQAYFNQLKAIKARLYSDRGQQ
ncbi:MAG: DUF5659 domain-containing protein [Candidatus Daviesbacteria bacterium]